MRQVAPVPTGAAERAHMARKVTLSERDQKRIDRAAMRHVRERKRVGALVPEIQTDTIIEPPRLKRTNQTDEPTETKLRGPTAVRAAWRDPDDLNPHARTAPLVHGYKRRTALDRLAKVSQSRQGLIFREHVRAADRYLADCEAACPGMSFEIDPTGVRPPFGPRLGGDAAAWAAEGRVIQAREALGMLLSSVVDAIVLGNQDVKAYAAEQDIDDKVAKGLLVAGLTRLVEHYGPRNLKRGLFEDGE